MLLSNKITSSDCLISFAKHVSLVAGKTAGRGTVLEPAEEIKFHGKRKKTTEYKPRGIAKVKECVN